MAVLQQRLLSDSGSPSYGEINLEQVQRMISDPTSGPFYMVNLMRYRDVAVYPDGRETDLTGEEANALYAPIEFLSAIGANIVFVGAVEDTLRGVGGDWDDVAIVEYPCPIAFFAMSTDPEFQARAVHKEAGMASTIVMVTHLEALQDVVSTDSPYPPTAEDPSFEHVQAFRFSAATAGEEYSAAIADKERSVGIYPKARLMVEGVFIGDGRAWDEVWIDYVPSRSAWEALQEDPVVVEAEAQLEGDLEEAYGLVTQPMLSVIPSE